MPFIPAPQVAQVAIVHSLDGEEVTNVLNWAIGAAVSETNLTSLANAVLESWTGEMMPNLSAALSLVEVRARDLTVADGSQVAVANPTVVIGGVTGEALPSNVALVITHRTAFIGRSRRGRTYIGGLAESQVNQNTVNALASQAIEDAFNAMRTDVAVTGWFFGVLSRYTNKAPREVGVFTPATLSIVRDRRVDSQRGRLPD